MSECVCVCPPGVEVCERLHRIGSPVLTTPELLAACATDCNAAAVAWLMCAHPCTLLLPCRPAVDAFPSSGVVWRARKAILSPPKLALRQRLLATGQLSARGEGWGVCVCA